MAGGYISIPVQLNKKLGEVADAGEGSFEYLGAFDILFDILKSGKAVLSPGYTVSVGGEPELFVTNEYVYLSMFPTTPVAIFVAGKYHTLTIKKDTPNNVEFTFNYGG